MQVFKLFRPMLSPRTHLYAHKLIQCLMQLRNNRCSHSLYSIFKMMVSFLVGLELPRQNQQQLVQPVSADAGADVLLRC